MENQENPTRQRGRPRKATPAFRFSPYVYNTPLGCQYTQPTVITMPYKMAPIKLKAVEEVPIIREKRSAAVKLKKRKKVEEESSFSEESISVEEDPYEKLLDYNEEDDKYFVKLRNKSYIHCAWIPSTEIGVTRVGAMKIKRYKKSEIDPDFLVVDRVLLETIESNEKLFLIKWKKLPYELSTFELLRNMENVKNFIEELRNFRERKKIKNIKNKDWRPAREQQVKYDEMKKFKNDNILRHYQIEGVNWLLNRWYFKQSCIMADEMGLGKTVQSVTFINSLFQEFDYNLPALIIAPLSTLVHWEREFQNWTDLRVITYHGSISGRDVIANYELFYKNGNINIRMFDVIITTYEMAMAGAEHLSFEFGVAIFDEAHRLKNANSKATLCLKNFSINHKVLLSGTPIQNNLNELWSLFNFIEPSRFSNLTNFLNEYKMESSEDVQKLQAVLKPLMLRRMKEDVETGIPMKEETIIEVELTTMQKRYYKAILEKNLEFLKGKHTPNLINAMMELRKCCIHPYLLKGAEEKIVQDYLKRKKMNGIENNLDGSESTDSNKGYRVGDFVLSDVDEYFKILIQSSGKLVLLDKLLNKLKDGHKVLIFSQMTKCLDLLSDYLNYRNYKFERIDGGVRGDLRQSAIDRFTSGDGFVFLLCTRAGGVGINLTAADTCVIFDSDWNPQNDLQAQARCHRIGQKNEVKIYRLITRNSYEREMFDKAGMKLGLDRAILQRMHFEKEETAPANANKSDAIQLLLRKGAYGVLMDDDASQKFCEEDIDLILERRTKVIKHNENGNVFSKASFQVEEDVEDPDFWDNILNQKKSQEEEGRMKRLCRRLSREGNLIDEEKNEIACAYKNLNLNDLKKQSSDILDSNIELEYYSIFLAVLNGKSSDFNINICENSDEESLSKLKCLVKYSLDLITNKKIRSDFSLCLDSLVKDYDPSNFVTYSDMYLKFHEKFLFRVQIPLIMKDLASSEDLFMEKARGWSYDDDKHLVNFVMAKGYDNFTYKSKSMDEINQRIRKILTVLFHRREIRENNNMFFKAIMNFGRVTDSNEIEIERFLNKDLGKLKELVDKIHGMSKRSRKQTSEVDCYERIVFFDKLESLTEFPAIRKSGIPKKWDSKQDKELRACLLKHGLLYTSEKFDLTEDLILKRFDTIFKTIDKSDGGK